MQKSLQDPILEALPLPPTEPPSASTSVNSDVSSPVVHTPTRQGSLTLPRTALDMLIGALKNVDNPVNFQAEIRMNICSLFIQIGKNGGGEDLKQLKEKVKPVLESVSTSLKSSQGREEQLASQVHKVLDAWS